MDEKQQKGPIFHWSYRYLNWMEVQSYSKSTIINRKTGLMELAHWCEERGFLTLAALNSDIIRRYQSWLHHHTDKKGRPLSKVTQQARLIAVRSFCKWLYKEKLISSNIVEDLILPKVKKKLPSHVLRFDEVESILGVPDISTPIGLRDRTMLELLYSTGLRRKELVGLKLCDIDFVAETLFVSEGKGGFQRYVPVGWRAMHWINHYIQTSRHQLTTINRSDELFIGSISGKRLSVHQLGQIVKKYLKEAGIERKGSCHLFRHSCATQMLENGADIRYIQQLLGHRDISSTQIYTQVSMAKLKEVHEKFHPAEQRTKYVSSPSPG